MIHYDIDVVSEFNDYGEEYHYAKQTYTPDGEHVSANDYAALADLKACEEERIDERNNFVEKVHAYLGVEDPCEACGGIGRKAYGSTTTWRGGIGGQAITSDVCDKCWGTGDINRKGYDLRKLTADLASAQAEVARLKAALVFYADPNTYLEQCPLPGEIDGEVPITTDGGSRAQAALKETP